MMKIFLGCGAIFYKKKPRFDFEPEPDVRAYARICELTPACEPFAGCASGRPRCEYAPAVNSCSRNCKLAPDARAVARAAPRVHRREFSHKNVRVSAIIPRREPAKTEICPSGNKDGWTLIVKNVG